MKKITLFSAFLALMSFGMHAQVDHLETGTAPQFGTETSMAPCTFTVANDNLYGGAINVSRYASRFTIPQNEIFEASEVTMILGVVNDPTYEIDQTTELKFTIYPDNAGPDAEITSAIVTPTSAIYTQTVTLNSGAVWDLYEVNVNLSTLAPVTADPSADTPFFFGIEMTQDDGVQVGLNFTQAATGSITYFDDGSGWAVFNASSPDDISFTYVLEGDCVLSVEDNLISQVFVYPNPAADVINIKTPSNIQVTGATLYDLLGKNTGVVYTNGQVNVSTLSRGVYMLTVETNEGSLTQKIVKR